MAFEARNGSANPWQDHRGRVFLLVLCIPFLVAVVPLRAALGDLPLVNSLQGGNNFFNLNFTQPASNQQIALFVISSNDPNGFSVKFTFSNNGAFAAGGRSFAMSNLVLNGISGVLGAGLTAPVNQAITLDGSGEWTWTPGNTPTTETVNYIVEIKTNWTDQSSGIAGLYLETINAIITGGP